MNQIPREFRRDYRKLPKKEYPGIWFFIIAVAIASLVIFLNEPKVEKAHASTVCEHIRDGMTISGSEQEVKAYCAAREGVIINKVNHYDGGN